ncbi:MAG TPA: hypothetical protein VHB79_39620 [Polyangiaceae bacterium]|nr:hypothetical protein [Polyangiaceae bacterium]
MASSSSPTLPLSFSDESSSARVLPRLTIAMGTCKRAAARAKRKPEKTINDVPAISNVRAPSSASITVVTRAAGTFSPKKTTSGLSTPPHASQGATRKRS